MEMSADLMDRVTGPVQRALTTASMSMENIDQVILVGGGTRIPKVQELLSQYVGQELGKSLNTDESAAMGAVYRSADISTGFKVKKFLTKDAVMFPIDVDFTRELEGEDDAEPGVKKVKRTLFSRMNPFPQKKIMTFNKHVKDFTFNVNYAELEYLGETEVANIGSQNLTSVLVKGVKEALDGNQGDNIETKGVKAHFQLDDSGILTCTHVESVFEKTISPEEQEEKEKAWKEATDSIDWSKLGDNIKSFFGSDAEKKDENAEGEKKEDVKEDTKKEKDTKDSKKDTKDEKKDKKDDKPKEPKKPKVESVKVDLVTEGSRNDLELLDGEGFDSSKAKLAALNQADLDRLAVETALNELQSFSFDLSDKMEDEEYVSASTAEERELVLTECSKVSEWLDEEAGMFTPVDEFNTKLKVLKDLSAPLVARVREHKERPEALEQLRQSINSSNVFLEKSREYLIKPKPKAEKVVEPVIETAGEGDQKEEKAKDDVEDSKKEDEKPKETSEEKPKPSKKKVDDEGLFKEKELDSLKKKIAEVEKWRDDKLAEQAETPLSEMPKLTVSMIKSKIQDLDSEVQFLIQKARMLKAEKEREKRKLEAEEKKAEEERLKKEKKAKKKKANATESDGKGTEEAPTSESTAEGDANTTDEKPESETLDEVKVDENEKDSTSDGSSESTGETKTEL